MKSVILCSVLAAAAFVAMGIQTGLWSFARPSATPAGPAAKEETPPAPVKPSQFPEDLAPAARAQAVPKAAAFKSADAVHPLVYLTLAGSLHKWQEFLDSDWAAERVEDTQLAVIVGTQKKSLVGVQHYPNGAPPVSRFQYELEVSVIEAKTGKVVANRIFLNVPREIKPLEAFELTAIGQPVSQRTVFHWLVSEAGAGFPMLPHSQPLTNIVE